jgi:hypothetical protein
MRRSSVNIRKAEMPPELPEDRPFVDPVMSGRIAGSERRIDLSSGGLYAQGNQSLDQFGVDGHVCGRLGERSSTIRPVLSRDRLIHVAAVVKDDVSPISADARGSHSKAQLLKVLIVERTPIPKVIKRRGHDAGADQQVEMAAR